MKRYIAMFAFFLAFTAPSSVFGFDVTLTINVTKLPDNRVHINGKTNLPLGTELMLSVEEKMNNGFLGQSSCVVSDKGTFSSELFGPKGGLKDGRYVAEVLMPIPTVQPVAARKIIGMNGENLSGNLVSKDEFGTTVSQQTEFTIGVAPDAAQAERKMQTELATSKLKKQLCIYLEQLLSFKDEPKFKQFGFSIGGPYNKWLTNVEELRDAQPIGAHPIPLLLRAAPGDLLMLGMAFMRVADPTHTGMRESDTKYIRQMLPEIKDTIDFNSYQQNKER
ncbi:MAG: hypothetical protein A2521_09720 [Deltaproteobacteria bacterium RIFOXYD12_FULL_57_12]|nr:MAG: hypothetical protein A2521_09720 [Deltaproteobacteria bacterium RIFOXYD12_FULL_57_12]